MLKRETEQRQAIEMLCVDMMVPGDHLLRKIDAAVDFTRIYDLVEGLYCEDNGRPCCDPVVLFKLVMIQHLFGIRSLRQTLRDAEVNVAYAVGLKSSSTVYNYLTRMTKRGLVASEPGKPRSLHVLEPRLEDDPCDDGGAVLSCKFRFPNGTYPVSVIAMVADDDKQFTPVKADQVEVLRMKPVVTKKVGMNDGK